jgi:hypothetical protein
MTIRTQEVSGALVSLRNVWSLRFDLNDHMAEEWGADTLYDDATATYRAGINVTLRVSRRGAVLHEAMQVPPNGAPLTFAQAVEVEVLPTSARLRRLWLLTWSDDPGDTIGAASAQGVPSGNPVHRVYPPAGLVVRYGATPADDRRLGQPIEGLAWPGLDPLDDGRDQYAVALRVARKGRVLYDSGDVAGGAAIVTPVLDLTAIEELRILVRNDSPANTRGFDIEEYADAAGTSIVLPYSSTLVAAVSSKNVQSYGRGVAGAAIIQATAPLFARWRLQAAGASAARVVIIGR